MFYIARVTKWVSNRYSNGLITPSERSYGKDILLNANRMSDIKTNGSGTKFNYTLNLNDPRDGKAYVEVVDHWNLVTNALDTAYPSEFTLLPVYKDDDTSKATVTITIPSSTIAYAIPHPHDYNLSYVVYTEGGAKSKRVLVNSSIEDISAINLLFDIDGNRYMTVTVGAVEWMTENLRVTHYADGSAIPYITDDVAWLADTTGARCWYNHNDGFAKTYGSLYNWYAVTNISGLPYFERAGVQQAGWRVSTRADWDTLVAAIGDATNAGGRFKERGLAHWNYPNVATDTLGFRARSSGNRFYDAADDDFDIHGFISMGIFEDWWTSEQFNATDGYSQYIANAGINFIDYTEHKYGGAMVRCCRG